MIDHASSVLKDGTCLLTCFFSTLYSPPTGSYLPLPLTMPPPPPIFTNPFPLVLSQEEEEELELALLERQSQFSTSPFDQPPNWVISNHSQDSQTSSLDQTIDIEFAFSFDKGRKSSLVVEEEEPETKPISTPSSSFQSTTTSLDSLEKFQDDPILPDTIENRRPVSLFQLSPNRIKRLVQSYSI